MATHGAVWASRCSSARFPVQTGRLTNTLPALPPKSGAPQLEVLSIAPIIAEALSAVFDDTSVSEIFGDKDQ
jgi:ribose-phosphate pyrophosphokinase